LFKSNLDKNGVVGFFSNSAGRSYKPWQIKILTDKQLVQDIVKRTEIDTDYWILLSIIASHPGVFMHYTYFYFIVNIPSRCKSSIAYS
jgi:hypothetical protein